MTIIATATVWARVPRQSNHQHLAEAALEASYDSVVITTADLGNPEIVYVNPAFCQMTGWEREEVIGRTPAILQGEETDHEVTRRLRQALAEGRTFEGRTINYRKDGRPFHIEWRTSPVTDAKGEVTHYVAIQRDVTARIRLLRRLQERAESDGLTELLNHAAGQRELETNVADAHAQDLPLSIVLLDIDHFKAINDDHGHALGDLVLERVGRLINLRLNRQDLGVRWGGEEFLLVLLETELDGARRAAETFRKLIAETSFHDEIRVTASFGIAQLLPGERADALFNRADKALYAAKEAGRDRVCVAAPD